MDSTNCKISCTDVLSTSKTISKNYVKHDVRGYDVMAFQTFFEFVFLTHPLTFWLFFFFLSKKFMVTLTENITETENYPEVVVSSN